MIFVRLLPVILSTILIAAHVLRFHGIIEAIAVLLLLLSLLLKRKLILRLWQAFLAFGVIMWIRTTIELVSLRMAMDAPWLRLTLILAAVTSFTLFAIFWLENNKIKQRYRP